MKSLTTILASIAIAVVTLAGSATTAHAAPAPDAAHVRSHTTPRSAAYTAQVLALVNVKRVAHGCSPLRPSPAITRAARKHSNKMAKAGVQSHQLPGERPLGARITKAGYQKWKSVGENVAYGWPTPKSVVRGWMKSRDHRRNILKCSFRDTGVGYAVSAAGVAFWTQDFGRQ